MLGTGGLVKAYGGGVQQALNLLITTRKTPLTEYTLLCDYAQLSGIEALLKQFNGVIAHSDYQAMVQLRVALPQAELAAFQQNSLILVAVHCNYCRLKNNPHLTILNT